MFISIYLFGITRDIVGDSHLQYELPAPIRVKEFLADLKSRYPSLQNLASLAVAVNSEYAEEEQLIQERDEVALIPPVSGG